MRVLVSGASGLIGSTLLKALARDGHQAIPLVRQRLSGYSTTIFWDPAAGRIAAEPLNGLDAVVHLAGAPIAARWTSGQKTRILESRVHGTRLLAQTLAALSQPPRVLVCASAVGCYGNRGDARLTEQSAPGQGFLAEVCQAWEAATQPAAASGIRVVLARLGLVLDRSGGALAKMLPPFRLGFGGPLGSGLQYWSWIAMEDVVGAIAHALATERLAGPINVVAPGAVTNREFTRALGRVLRRPTLLPVPPLALRLLLGEMADALLLSSTRVEPRRLLETGYRFQYADLDAALQHLFGGSVP